MDVVHKTINVYAPDHCFLCISYIQWVEKTWMSFTRLSTCMHLTAVFSLYQLHSVGGEDMDVVHKTINVYAPDRCVFFVSATFSGWRRHGCRSQDCQRVCT